MKIKLGRYEDNPYIVDKVLTAFYRVKDYILPNYKHNWWDKIRCTFRPNQRWIKQHVEYKGWCDKSELIPQLLFACVINYVEPNGEDCFNVICWEATPEHSEVEKGLRECYEYIKTGRKKLVQEGDNELERASGARRIDTTYEEAYGEHDRLEKLLEDTDEKWLIWVVQNRHYLWT
jgi:hypothetical protein